MSETNNTDYVMEKDPQYNVPTAELLKTFPIRYETPAVSQMNKNVQNRMLNGFNQWNHGYEAWEKWGNVLYYPGSVYTVHGVRLTLKEYQQAMQISLKRVNIQMGNFMNMLLVDDWMAIQYEISTNGHPGRTMEFARFKDFGDRGAKVDEGWGGVRAGDYDGMMMFLKPEEKEAQKKYMDEITAMTLKDTDNLDEKYPVEYPTTISTEKNKQMKEAVLAEIDAWNKGYESWSKNADSFYTENASVTYGHQTFEKAGLKDAMKKLAETKDVKRVKVMNVLTSEDWLAIHYWNSVTEKDSRKTAIDTMTFFHFNDDMKVDLCFVNEYL